MRIVFKKNLPYGENYFIYQPLPQVSPHTSYMQIVINSFKAHFKRATCTDILTRYFSFLLSQPLTENTIYNFLHIVSNRQNMLRADIASLSLFHSLSKTFLLIVQTDAAILLLLNCQYDITCDITIMRRHTLILLPSNLGVHIGKILLDFDTGRWTLACPSGFGVTIGFWSLTYSTYIKCVNILE